MLITTPYVQFAPVVDGSTSGVKTSATNTTSVTLPASVKAGDILIIILGWNATGTNTLSGWSSVGINGTLQFFHKLADGTEGGTTVTINHSNTTRARWFAMRIYNNKSDMDTGSNLKWTGASNSSSVTTEPLSSVSPSWGGDQDLIVTAIDIGNSVITSFTSRPTNFTSLGTVTNVGTMGVDWGWLTGSTLSPSSYQTAAAGPYFSLTIALH